jgi:hypothetical protein
VESDHCVEAVQEPAELPLLAGVDRPLTISYRSAASPSAIPLISTWSRLVLSLASEDPSNPDGRVQQSFLGRGVREELGHEEPLRLFEVGQELFRPELAHTVGEDLQ